MEKQISELLQKIIQNKYNIELDEVKLEFPPKKDLWDFAFGCFVLSRQLKKHPNIIATEISKFLQDENLIDEANPAGPYINLKISKTIFTVAFDSMYSDQNNFLSPKISNGEKVIIDYIWANVGKPLHIGHICTPLQGQSMINLYNKLWYDVISDSHIGDWGVIFWKLITAYKLWWEEKKLSENAVDYLLELYVKITSESDKNPDLEQQIRNEFKSLSGWNEDSKKLWAMFTSHSIEAMNKQLNRLNVFPQYNIWESFYEGLWLKKMEDYPDLQEDMSTIVKELIGRNIATKNEDNSVGVVFHEDTKYPSCILQKRDGTHGYLASDLACIKYRMQNWSPVKMIYFVDVRQKLHLEQAFEIAKKAYWLDRDGQNDTVLFHAYNWFISWKEGPFSSRKGNIIKMNDLLNEAQNRARKLILEKRDDFTEIELENLSKIIWIWAIKYGYLKKSRDTDVIFDWDEFMTFEGNSGPYIQYAYVRANRLLENYGKKINSEITWEFDSQEEVELVKILGTYKEVLLKTAETNMPHHICKYAFTLTKAFSSFYNAVHILNEEDESKKMIRLQLVDLFAKTLQETFLLLWIDMPDKM